MESSFQFVWELFLLSGAILALAFVGWGTSGRRRTQNASTWQSFCWRRIQVIGASLALWFALAFVFLPPGLAVNEFRSEVVFWVGLFLAGYLLPTLAMVWRFGLRSMLWSRDTPGLG